jgi:hypothetical protein
MRVRFSKKNVENAEKKTVFNAEKNMGAIGKPKKLHFRRFMVAYSVVLDAEY